MTTQLMKLIGKPSKRNRIMANNANTELEQSEITSYSKGSDLENEFAQFMKEKLGWENVRVGVHLSGRVHVKGANVDIVGKRLTESGKTLKAIGIVYLIFCVIPFVIGAITPEYDFLVYVGLFLEIVGFIILFAGINRTTEYVLVECKNLKGKATAAHIDKTLREINDYMASGDKQYKFRYHYFVSANGYVETTLKYAQEKGIVCFVKKGDSFEQEFYWK